MNEKENGASRRATSDNHSLSNSRSYANLVNRNTAPSLNNVGKPITREYRLGTTPPPETAGRTPSTSTLKQTRSYAETHSQQATISPVRGVEPITRENRINTGAVPKQQSPSFIASKSAMKYETVGAHFSTTATETRTVVSSNRMSAPTQTGVKSGVSTPTPPSCSVTPSIKSVSGEENSESQSITKKTVFVNRPVTSSVVGSSVMGAASISHSRISTASAQQRMTYAERATQYRIKQMPYATSYRPSAYGKSWKYETAGSFNEALAKYKTNPVRFADSAKGAVGIGGRRAVGAAQDALSSADDNLGNSTTSAAIAAGVGAVTAFTVAQKASPVLVSGFVKTGKGAYDVATTVGALHLTIKQTAQFARSSFVPLSSTITRNVFMRNAYVSGLTSTDTSRAIINAVTTIKAKALSTRKAVTKTATTVRTAAQTTARAATKTFVFAKRVANGNISFATISHATLQKLHSTKATMNVLAKRGIKGVPHLMGRGANLVGRGAINGSVKSASWLYHRGFRHIGNAALGIGGALAASDDMMISGAGHAMTIGTYGVRATATGTRLAYGAGKSTIKGGTRLVKGGAKTIQSVKKGISFAKTSGWKNAWKVAWKKGKKTAGNAVVNAGKSIVSALMNVLKTAGRKVALPLLLIAALIAATSGVFTAPVAAIGSIFSGAYDTTNADGTHTETQVRDFLLNTTSGIPAMRTTYIKDLYKYMQKNLESNGGDYENVYFNTNQDATKVSPTIDNITSAFYSEDDLANIIQPIFNAILLKDYNLAPTNTEANNVLKTLFNSLFSTTESVQTIAHHHTDSEGNSYTTYTYRLTVTLNMDGLYELQAKYFTDPIDVLLNNPNRTEKENQELSELQDYYEIYLAMVSQVSTEYGGGLTMDDLSGVTWINGSRTSNQGVADLALSQVGETGGQPYWSAYGFTSRVAWCACFVQWCMNNSGVSDLYAHSANNAYCPTLTKWFSDNGRWASGGFTDMVAGDTIFFDWEGDGSPDHIGLVIGRDDTYVYTVEGNSGDAVRAKKYALNSSVIYGYGLMNY